MYLFAERKMTTNFKMARSLYDITVAAVSNYYKSLKGELRDLPETVMFDVYLMLYQQGRLCVLGVEFSDLEVFSRMLKVTNNRVMLLKCFQSLMTHGTGVAKELANSYIVDAKVEKMTPDAKDAVIDLGIRLGGFLSEAGWFEQSGKVLVACKEVCESLPDNIESWKKHLECCHKLLHAQVMFSQIYEAASTKIGAEYIVAKLCEYGQESVNLAALYTEFSLKSFQMSDYNEAYRWSVKAINELRPNVCSRITIETLSQASKACVVKREFAKAAALIRQAVFLARSYFGETHPKFADTLLDYGYYLLNSDSIKDSVTVYESALKLKEAVFGSYNLHVAIAHEDLAYALYVHEYSSGRFIPARQHAEEAIAIMMQLLPEEHLMLASAQRVKALILEEIALDNLPGNASETQPVLLAQAEKLHKDALRLALISFGENNVQTAKHFGNLGRLYQSMKRYEEAEAMHLRAITIKETLLGREDYEVGLSIGHLASLYNYHMKEHRKAEKLYYRSINISLKLFSETYSGLEYDYRGLMHVYEALGEADRVARFMDTMSRWKELREAHNLRESAPLALSGPPLPLHSLQQLFSQ